MATYYWVGGSGTWDQFSTANWAATSGGVGGAGYPTAADDVVFDAGSDTGAPFTVTIGGTASANNPYCKTFSTGGAGGALDQTMTIAGSGRLLIYGDMTLPASSLIYSGTSTFCFQDTATLTTNGVTVGVVTVVTDVALNNVNTVLTLGSALTCSTLFVNYGTFSTGNYALTCAILSSATTNTRVINLGSSTVTLTGGASFSITSAANLTFNAGTSTIVFSNASPTIGSPGLTFYNVSFTSTAAVTATINGSNTFNNLTYTRRAATSITNIVLQGGQTQTINGTLNLGTVASALIRLFVRSSVFRTQTTLNVATMAAMSDVDFRDIAVTGAAAPISGTRIGNLLNDSGVTFTAGVNKYWSLIGGGNWTSTAWALSSGGVPASANFPLAQDTVIIEDTGLNSGATITVNANWFIGNITTATRTLPATIAFGTTAPGFYGNITLSSAITLTGTTGTLGLSTVYGITQTITSAGATWPKSVNLSPINATVVFADAFTVTGTANFSSFAFGGVASTIVFSAGTTNTATTFVFSGPLTVESSVSGSAYTLSQASGTVVAKNITFSDCTATGGATWTAPIYYGNVDSGGNTGLDFVTYQSINRGLLPTMRFGFKI